MGNGTNVDQITILIGSLFRASWFHAFVDLSILQEHEPLRNPYHQRKQGPCHQVKFLLCDLDLRKCNFVELSDWGGRGATMSTYQTSVNYRWAQISVGDN